MANATDSSADPEWVHALKQGGAFPLSDSPLCAHAWTSPPGNKFFVRGTHYLETKAKVPAGDPILQPIAFDIIKSSSKVSDIMEHPQCRVREALHAARASATLTDRDGVPQKPFVWVFNLQLPTKENVSLVLYYASFHSPEKGSLMQRFLDGDDTFRNERLKLLTNIAEGPQLLKLAVGDRGAGCLLGKIWSCRYRREMEYMEVDADMGSSIILRTAIQISSGFAQHVTVELAFVIEGRYEDELPERIVGAIRLANTDFSCAIFLDRPPLTSQEPVIKDYKRRASYGGLWKFLSTSMQGAQLARQLPTKDADEEKKKKLCDGISKTLPFP